MAKRTREQLAEVRSTARHYLYMTNNNPQLAWNEYIKAHLLSGKSFSPIGHTLKDFVQESEVITREQSEREAFFLQCDKERESAKTTATATETDAQFMARLLTLPKQTVVDAWQQYKTTTYKDAVLEFCMAYGAQDAQGIRWQTVSQLREVIN